MTKHYPEIDANPDFAALEEEVLQTWAREKTFEQSVSERDPANSYVFYDGPPFANGLPHYGHLLTGYVKDAVARYQTMRGRRVERRFGWDCHGLPAEMGAEKELGISGRAAITEYGIGKFNDYCRSSVMKYTSEWEYYVTRQGRWVDFKHDYKTMDKGFMESCIWAFKELWNKGLVYESMRVMPYSWAAETPVSNFETRIDNATRPREDKAATVAFKLTEKSKNKLIERHATLSEGDDKDIKNVCLMAWTTTPWTLPSNLALAVSSNSKMHYIGILKDETIYILASASREKYLKELDPATITTLFGLSGKDLIDLELEYEPLFPYFADTPNAFRILDGSAFVSDAEGTGIVHMAPGFGEDDQKCCAANGIEVIVPVDEKGRYTDEIFELPNLNLAGLNVIAETAAYDDADKANHISDKDVAKFGLANMRILRWLKASGKLVKDEVITHNYPHCWRTDTPLIYRAMSSWYINLNEEVPALNNQSVKQVMAANNQQITWIPEHVKNGQMGKGIESAPDWSISRNRFWGTPIPIWKSASGKIHVCGSIAEIEKLSGQKVADLHRPIIDDIVLNIDGEEYRRIEDVFDCWFESGSMPFAQLHYPFENKAKFEASFPADFITEYIAQTRGWFYTLQVLSAALFGCAPFKNCICHGVVIDEETGLKYSKRLKNYKDPKEVMNQYGADALRWMMLASPVMRGADLAVDPDGKFIRDVVRLNIKPIWNAYNFFTLYANADGVKAKAITTSENMLDRYILAKAKKAVSMVKWWLDVYQTAEACLYITEFFELMNNWYIRRSKDRFWKETHDADKQAAYDTLFTVLNVMMRAAAPLLPFTTEAVYRGLNGTQTSVHLQDFPDVSGIENDADLVPNMDRVRDVCNAASAVRNKASIRNRQPLAALKILGWQSPNPAYNAIIADEINVKEVIFSGEENLFHYAVPRLKVFSQVVGKKFPKEMKNILVDAKNLKFETIDEGQIRIAGVVLKQQENDFTLALEPTKDYEHNSMPFSTNGLVILDLIITDELKAEGMARDLVRMIQQARKDAGLDVSDRIALVLDLPRAMQPALAHQKYIEEQTLSVSITQGGAGDSENVVTQEMDGEKITIGISKAA
jgi:isoleucyl-tRNA synthetase